MTRTRVLPIPCLVWLLLFIGGCRGGMAIPAGWTADPVLSEARAWQAPAQVQRDQAPRLQVMVHYNRTHGSHTTVRVTHSDAPAVFWDPGGEYGRTRPEYGRRHDVIVEAPPDLSTWWVYRKRWIGEPIVYVFEWDVHRHQARVMRDALLDGARRGRDDPLFYTQRYAGLCGFAVCEFLRRFGPPAVSVNLRDNFLPDGLAKQLWQHNPDRVLRYEGAIDATPTVWVPPPTR